MRRFAFPLLAVLLILSVGVLSWLPAAAQTATPTSTTATLTIVPPSLARSSSLVVNASGLTPNTRYTFDFVLAADDSVIFSTERTADGGGNATVSIRSDGNDVLGEYRVEARTGDEVVAQATFTLTQEAAATPTLISSDVRPTAEPGQPTPLPTSAVPNETSVRVRPAQGRVRQTFNIRVSGLETAQTIFVTVREIATNAVVYDREWTANNINEVQIDLFTTSDNAPGDYIVEINDSSNRLLNSTIFTLEGVGGRNALLTITPRTDTTGTSFDMVITEAQAFSDLTFNVLDPDTNESVFEGAGRTNVDGTVTVVFPLSAEIPLNAYEVIVSDIDGEVTRGTLDATLSMGTLASDDTLTMRVNPKQGLVGRVFNISVVGLTPSSTVTIQIVDGSGSEVASFDQRVNQRGSSGITWGSGGAAAGEYTARAVVADEVVITQTFEVSATDDVANDATATATEEATDVAATPTVDTVGGVSMVIEPTSGPQGTSHRATVSGLPANTNVTYVILYNDMPMLTTTVTGTDTGISVLTLNSAASDAAGVYTLQALIASEVVATATFEITAAPEATSTLPAPTATPASDPLTATVAPTMTPAVTMTATPFATDGASLMIAPEEGQVGTTYTVTISGLPSQQKVTLEVVFDNNVVFTIDRTLGNNGSSTVRLTTSATDAPGLYTVNLLVNGQSITSGSFTVTAVESDAVTMPTPVPDATLTTPGNTVTPSAAEIETISNELTASAPIYTYSFEGSEGEMLAIGVSSDSFDTYVSVNDSDGILIASNDDFDNTNSRIAALVLPYDDTYTIAVTSYSHWSDSADVSGVGGFRLAIERIDPTPFALNTRTAFDFTGVDRYYLTLDLTSTDIIDIRGFGDGLDTQVELISPFGYTEVADDDSGAGYDPEVMSHAITSSGTYIVVFSLVNPGEGGTASLEITSAPDISLSSGPQIVRLSQKTSSVSLTFAGGADTVTVIDMALQAGTATDVNVQAVQDDTVLMSYSSGSSLVPQLSLPIGLVSDSPVRVTISTYSGTVTYEVSVR